MYYPPYWRRNCFKVQFVPLKNTIFSTRQHNPFLEQMLFIFLALFAIGATYVGFRDMYLVINQGQGKLHLNNFFARAFKALRIYVTQETTLKTRRVTSLFHLGVVIGFTFYFLVN